MTMFETMEEWCDEMNRRTCELETFAARISNQTYTNQQMTTLANRLASLEARVSNPNNRTAVDTHERLMRAEAKIVALETANGRLSDAQTALHKSWELYNENVAPRMDEYQKRLESLENASDSLGSSNKSNYRRMNTLEERMGKYEALGPMAAESAAKNMANLASLGASVTVVTLVRAARTAHLLIGAMSLTGDRQTVFRALLDALRPFKDIE